MSQLTKLPPFVFLSVIFDMPQLHQIITSAYSVTFTAAVVDTYFWSHPHFSKQPTLQLNNTPSRASNNF